MTEEPERTPATGKRVMDRLPPVVGRLVSGVGAVDFGTRIIIFGASMMLSVVPLIVLLSSFASHRIDGDLSHHLALSPQGARLMARLFKSAPGRFNVAILLSLVLSFTGAISVARSVQTGYESVFSAPPASGVRNLGRCCVWIAVTGGLLIADGFVAPHVGHRVVASACYAAMEVLVLGLYFAWTMHLLLRASIQWRATVLPTVLTVVFWLGLRLVAALYFSPTVVSDGHTYGTVGVVFTLLTWFIAIDAVVLLGAIVAVALVPRLSVNEDVPADASSR